MRTFNGKAINELKNRDYAQWLKPNVTCHEISTFKELFNQTEPIIVRLLQYYFGDNSKELMIFWRPRYKGNNGCNQELDITIEICNELFFGLSIKSRFGGGYLEPNDLSLTLLQEYKSEIKKFEIRGSINDVLQDMARIGNIKDITNGFKTVTILFDKPHQTKWIDRMKSLFEDHEYIFLTGNINNFFEELERIHPEIKGYKAI
ncbi:hypothetical protein [Paenibacillus thalictri]|uniref:Uncharacterized protein n=1 Tax=Paenibacillus thalictri TaxID=2527873 RepID=A0A4Q9DC03_9BACL|nr:hypothetical protein [Paenibacillus thalictri]TBL67463.1 hypothetical protein EYB31_39695 [Paenibacillus thalictri]